jgi:fructose-specific phosphotransferase system IIB component
MDEGFRQDLLNAKTPEEFLSKIDKKEAEKDAEEAAEAAETVVTGYKVLAVTACPTGIAHTFMDAENLTKAGEKLGVPLKAETNGSEGVRNALTVEEIAACDGIIVAADKNVEMARLDGKPVLTVPVTEGIRHPEELINKIENGEAPIYHASADAKEAAASGQSAGRSFYKHLMNGVSHMLPFVVAGGMMSIDMGGPFNKAAYVTATGLLASGNYILMAAVMAGGMVPPLAIALSTTFFKNKWTEDERNAGLVNYIIGLSFIFEGAIPFAANDPIHVIPSCVIG